MLLTDFEKLLVQRGMSSPAQQALLPVEYRPVAPEPDGDEEQGADQKEPTANYIALALAPLSDVSPVQPARLASILMLSRVFRSTKRFEAALTPGAITVIDAPVEWCPELSALLQVVVRRQGRTLRFDDIKSSRTSYFSGEISVAIIDLSVAGDIDQGRWTEITKRLLGTYGPIILINPENRALQLRIPNAFPSLRTTVALDVGILRRVHRVVCGGGWRQSDVPRSFGPGDLTVAFRPGVAPAQVVDALVEVSSAMPITKADVPPLTDLHGMDPVRAWAEDLKLDVEALRSGQITPKELSRGILISSEPGAGKTYAARVVAAHAGIDVVVASVARWLSFKGGHLGDFCSAVQRSFAEAREKAPCLLVLDEFDALPSRERVRSDNSAWWDAAIAAVLECLDGLEDRPGVVVMGLCNHPQNIDPAVLRAGRFDSQIALGKPTVAELSALLSICAAPDLVGVDLASVAVRLVGRTAADVARVVKDARRAARRQRAKLSIQHLEFVLEGELVIPPATVMMRLAIHEVGHGAAAVLNGFKVNGVSLAQALDPLSVCAGHASVSFGSMVAATWDEINARVRVLLAGRAAEDLIMGTVSGGARDDLKRATLLIAGALSSGLGSSLADSGVLGVPQAGLRETIEQHLARLHDEVLAQLAAEKTAIKELAAELQHTLFLDGVAFSNRLGVVGAEGAGLGGCHVD